MLGTMREAGLAKSPDVRASGAVLNASCIEFVTEAALKRGPCVDDHPIGWLVETERGVVVVVVAAEGAWGPQNQRMTYVLSHC